MNSLLNKLSKEKNIIQTITNSPFYLVVSMVAVIMIVMNIMFLLT